MSDVSSILTFNYAQKRRHSHQFTSSATLPPSPLKMENQGKNFSPSKLNNLSKDGSSSNKSSIDTSKSVSYRDSRRGSFTLFEEHRIPLLSNSVLHHTDTHFHVPQLIIEDELQPDNLSQSSDHLTNNNSVIHCPHSEVEPCRECIEKAEQLEKECHKMPPLRSQVMLNYLINQCVVPEQDNHHTNDGADVSTPQPTTTTANTKVVRIPSKILHPEKDLEELRRVLQENDISHHHGINVAQRTSSGRTTPSLDFSFSHFHRSSFSYHKDMATTTAPATAAINNNNNLLPKKSLDSPLSLIDILSTATPAQPIIQSRPSQPSFPTTVAPPPSSAPSSTQNHFNFLSRTLSNASLPKFPDSGRDLNAIAPTGF